MNAEVTSADKAHEKPGMKHWLFQVIPPLLMLGVFVITSNGTSLVFLVGLLLLPVLVSFVSIIVRLISFKKKKYFLVRPVLTISTFILVVVIANWTYQVALDQTVSEAEAVHRLCNENSSCPEKPVGWRINDSWVSRNDLGFWLKYTASYHSDNDSFTIRLYRGPDVGEIVTGGVNFDLKVSAYEDG